VLGFNLVLAAVGYCVLSASLAGRRPTSWASFAGVALLVGASLVGVGTFVAATVGLTTGLATFAGVALLIAVSGLIFRRICTDRLRAFVAAAPSPPQPPPSRLGRLLTLIAGFGVVVVGAFALVGGFRSSPWLDDVWGIWLPKGVALDGHGLDPRLFTESGRYVTFEVLDYPLWWSILLNLDLQFVGSVDLRAVNAQLTLLALAFLAAAVRLLHGYVRPWLLAAVALMLAASPEFFRHAQGGIADLPLAIYLSLYLLALAGWLVTRRGFYLLLAFPFAAAALAIKSEGLPELLIVLAVVTLLAVVYAREAVPGLLIASSAALLTTVPWFVWRLAHGIENQVAVTDALSPAYLADRTERLGPSIEAIGRHLALPQEWLALVPLVVGLGILGAVSSRRLTWLVPPFLLGAVFLFWIWAYWAETENLDYLLTTSSYRVADSLVLLAWVLLPVQGELLLRSLPGRGDDLPTWLVAPSRATF